MKAVISVIVYSYIFFVSGIFADANDESCDGDLRENVRFFLYTRSNANDPQRLYVDDAGNYNASKATKFYTHSFNASYLDVDSSLVRAGLLLASYDYNVIVVDWGNIAKSCPYETVVGRTKSIGTYIAVMIDFLVALGSNPDKMSLIGYGVGAHLMGSAGYLTSSNVTHVVGLDPARTGFDTTDRELRISKDSASIVEVVHTSDNSTADGHLDFYPNGGEIQLGCDNIECSRKRAYAYYAEAITMPKNWFGVQCDDYRQFLRRDYANKPIQSFPLTFGLVKKTRGLYYTRTAASSPYGLGFAGLTP